MTHVALRPRHPAPIPNPASGCPAQPLRILLSRPLLLVLQAAHPGLHALIAPRLLAVLPSLLRPAASLPVLLRAHAGLPHRLQRPQPHQHGAA
ncbi:hypothetical protein ABZP36_033128 [Zizania latifolia]